jgi:DNA-binding response OmpR family regulator
MGPTAILVTAEIRPPSARAGALRRAGLRVAEAYSGADVKRLMGIQPPDAVLMDAGITPAASADVWRALDQSDRAARVVVFGKFRHDAVRAHAREHGAICLTPRSEEDLVASIQELIKRYEMGRVKTERLHSELEANMRKFHLNARRSLLLDEGRAHSEDVVILVAEDEECVRRFLVITLMRRGYLVLEAGDGQEAVLALWNYAGVVRLVILDWAMPGLSGVDVVRTLRRVSPETRLLICTGSPEEVVRYSLHGETVEGILEKPFLAVDFLEAVEQQISKVQFSVRASRTADQSPQ